MAEKECPKRYPERDLAVIIVLAAVLFAVMSFTKNNPTSFATLQNAPETAVLQVPEAISGAGLSLSSSFCSSLPLVAYTVLLLLVIILLTYLLRKHFFSHALDAWWTYMLYVTLGLTVFLTAIEYILCDQALYSAIFAIAAIIVVFILDVLLTMIPKQRPAGGVVIKPTVVTMPKQKKESIFDRLRLHAIRPAEPGSREMAELKQVLKDLKELKKR